MNKQWVLAVVFMLVQWRHVVAVLVVQLRLLLLLVA
jgi:hypothetical protein